jgi:hypothetical protein
MQPCVESFAVGWLALVLRAAVLALVIATVGGLLFYGAYPGLLRLDQVPRIKVTAETTVAGKPVAGEWTVPAIGHWGPRPYLSGSWWTLRSPFDTVFLRLPDGRGLGVDLGKIGFDLTWYGQPIPLVPQYRSSSYFFLDSLDRPKVMSGDGLPSQCSLDSLVADCKVVTTMTSLGPGRVNNLRTGIGGSALLSEPTGVERFQELKRFGVELPKPLVFVSMGAWIYRSSSLFSTPEFTPLLQSLSKPTIVFMDWPTIRRLTRPDPGEVVGLVYEGTNIWSLDESRRRSPHGPWTAYLTDALTPDDVVCCGWGLSRSPPDRQAAVLSAIKYRGEVISYGPQELDLKRVPVLIDPDDGTVMTFFGPDARAIWMMPSR